MKEITSKEIDRICSLIKNYIYDNEKIVIGVSGGLDSDVVARLCVKAVGNKRVHLFFVKQEGTPEKRLQTVQDLAQELRCSLSVISLETMNTELIEAIHEADKLNFNPDSFMDYHRAKCSLRVAIFSAYQDNDFIFCSTTNRTEYLTGACMPYGDMLGNLRPIIHLYKTQVNELAKLLGTSDSVLNQSPSADFWEGEDDMDDLSYMLLNRRQVPGYRRFSIAEMESAQLIKNELSGTKIDLALEGFNNGLSITEIAHYSNLNIDICQRLQSLIEGAKLTRHRKQMVALESLD